jgi:hypothetical protein
LTYERIKYAALDARVSFKIAARSKELVAKPSPRENEKKNMKKKKKKKEEEEEEEAAPAAGHYRWMNYFLSCNFFSSLCTLI